CGAGSRRTIRSVSRKIWAIRARGWLFSLSGLARGTAYQRRQEGQSAHGAHSNTGHRHCFRIQKSSAAERGRQERGNPLRSSEFWVLGPGSLLRKSED